ncbi:hypothetical protein Mame01_33480 [Microbispora amethystogenes]|nr:hypothetical protein Mame01_33480 [Microbispora amethystogenes]
MKGEGRGPVAEAAGVYRRTRPAGWCPCGSSGWYADGAPGRDAATGDAGEEGSVTG